MNRQLNGWRRLGLALSVGWISGVALYTAFDYHRYAVKEAGWEVVPSKFSTEGFAGIEASDVTVVQHSWLTQCSHPQGPGKISSCDVRMDHLSALALGPVFLLWIVGFAGAWVRAGFNSYRDHL